MWQAKVEYHMRRRHQKVLLVTSITENEGKSTIAANIALALAEKNRKVLLVDGDLKKPAQNKVFEEEEEETFCRRGADRKAELERGSLFQLKK